MVEEKALLVAHAQCPEDPHAADGCLDHWDGVGELGLKHTGEIPRPTGQDEAVGVGEPREHPDLA